MEWLVADPEAPASWDRTHSLIGLLAVEVAPPGPGCRLVAGPAEHSVHRQLLGGSRVQRGHMLDAGAMADPK